MTMSRRECARCSAAGLVLLGIDPDLDGARRAYYGANLGCLRRIKAEIDPAGRFRPAQGIRA